MKKLAIVLKCIIAVAMLSTTVVGVNCSMHNVTPDEFEKWVEERNAAWAEAGYINDTGTTQTQQNNNTQNNQQTRPEKKVVKTCEHEYKDEITKEPTCSEPGEMISKCSKCGDSYKTELSPTGKHEYESSVTKEATCTEAGEMTYTCKICGDTYTEAIAAKGHDYEKSVTKEATCTEAGVTTYTCKNCGDTYTEEIPALGHKEGDWIITKDATFFFSTGEKVQKCPVCGEVLKTEEIPSKYPITYLYIEMGIAFAIIGFIIGLVFKKKRK